jgi:ferredoxin
MPNKYGHLIKPIPPFEDYGQGSYRQGTEMNGNFFGYDLNVRYGTFYDSGILEPNQTQVSDYDQYMVWMGADTYDLGYLGAQVEFCIGEEKERRWITTATAVYIPKGMPYGPITIGPMERRFMLLTVALTPELKTTPTLVGKPVGPYAKWMYSKYDDCFEELAFIRNGPWHYGPGNPDTHDGSITHINTRGFVSNMSYESMNKAPYRFTPEPDKPHVHFITEFLVLIGCDCNDLSEFPAEVEVCMGEEMETHLVTQPTVAIQPRGHPHCPVRVLRQDKPWLFMALRPWAKHTLDEKMRRSADRKQRKRPPSADVTYSIGDKCISCFACLRNHICPEEAIIERDEVFSIDADKCTRCAVCFDQQEYFCPVRAVVRR